MGGSVSGDEEACGESGFGALSWEGAQPSVETYTLWNERMNELPVAGPVGVEPCVYRAQCSGRKCCDRPGRAEFQTPDTGQVREVGATGSATSVRCVHTPQE